jgi:hypothetical protein
MQILNDPMTPRKLVPIPGKKIYQIGDLILQAVDKIPEGAVPMEVERLPDGSIPLGDGYVIYPDGKD